MPQISVVVPVYKVEPYLHRCVDSILGQTFTDFELILVDDGSPDNCPAICDEYASKDSRVHVIHQENGGLSAARNAGIDWTFANSDSQWLSFVDSDDWVHPEYLERLLNAADKYDVAVSICGYGETAGESIEVEPHELHCTLWTPEEFYAKHTITATVAWGKLYKRDCFSKIRYPVGRLHEDEFTTYKILFSQSQVAVISAPLYFYYCNPDSITTSVWTPRRMDAIQAFDEQLAFFAKSGFPIALKRRVRSYFWMLCAQYYGARSAPQLYHHEIKQIKKQMRKIMWKYDKLIDPTWHEYVTAYEIAYPRLNKIRNVFREKIEDFIMVVKSLKSHLITCWEKFYVSDLGLSAIYQWKNRKEHLHILPTEKTIAYILKHNCSVARFGEGEFELMLYSDMDLGFQKRDPELADRLKNVLASNDPNLLICIPYALNNINGRTKHSKMFWLNWGRTNDQHSRIVSLIRKLHPEGYCFGDTQITRPYIAYKTPKHGARVFPMLKELWNEQDVLFVEGEKTRLGIGNDLFDNAKSVKRVLCPATNAFDRYDEIIKAVTKVWNGELIMLALGPTATVLAADFASRGIRAIDLGHLDIEYEWFLSGAKGHDQIKGKFTNEASGGNVVAECDDIEYQQQIIYRVV